MRMILMILIVILLPVGSWADDRLVRLHAPVELIETGVMRHVLPRFTLKTQVRVELVTLPDEADMIWGNSGVALFQHGSDVLQMSLRDPGHAGSARFADWLRSDVGQRTILGFAPGGEPLFSASTVTAHDVVEIIYDGDPAAGLLSSRNKCGRCHAVDEAGRMNDIGSTPSFFVLRVFDDWDDRFLSFFLLRPHGPFTQIEGVTEPFAHNAPPPIEPIVMTLEELDDVLAYVATLEAADLGAPLVHQ